MKAIICTKYGPPEVLQLKDIPTPEPKAHEIRVKVFATTVTVADFRVRSFTIPPSFWIPARLILGLFRPRKPILGVELAGEIDAVGSGVTKFKKGDSVFAATLKDFGAYAAYKCLSENGPVALKPQNMSPEESAAIPIGGCTALHYLRKSGVKAGQKILIYGASGSVGTYAIQLANYFGAEVTAVCSASNAALVKSLGAHKTVDYTAANFTSKLELYDVIFIAVDKFPFSDCHPFLTKNGVYVNITAPVKSLRMHWISMTTEKKIVVGETASLKAEDLIFLKELTEAGVLNPVIDKRYPFEKMVEAHHYVGKGHKKGNVLITL
ncbi:MAG: NAD(P)-dependent alcohol dehydrogenase [Bacteroidetes bacterium]|nr:NAD(P)-dependent alcohol dehydrogenase [Bacteroidota bacterium]